MIQDYEQGKRLILSAALVQFDRVVRGACVVATWAINGTVWVERDEPQCYELRDTGVSIWEVGL